MSTTAVLVVLAVLAIACIIVWRRKPTVRPTRNLFNADLEMDAPPPVAAPPAALHRPAPPPQRPQDRPSPPPVHPVHKKKK